jgi:hypothetical protein
MDTATIMVGTIITTLVTTHNPHRRRNNPSVRNYCTVFTKNIVLPVLTVLFESCPILDICKDYITFYLWNPITDTADM